VEPPSAQRPPGVTVMATLNLPLEALYGVLLIFIRVAAILFSTPILDSGTIPFTFKVSLALAVSVLLLPLVDTGTAGDLSLMAWLSV
jgi:flagellar biosynthesis protein FliR